MIGCDIRKLDDMTRRILTNREMITVGKNPEGRQPWFAVNENDHLICVRPLADGDYAIGFFNMSDRCATVYLDFRDIGLPTAARLLPLSAGFMAP